MYHPQSMTISNSNDFYTNVMMMCIMPLIAALAQEIIKIFMSIFTKIVRYIENVYNKKINKMNIIKIIMNGTNRCLNLDKI